MTDTEIAGIAVSEAELTGGGSAGIQRLDDAAVRERLSRIDELLGQVEQVAGPTMDSAMEAVQGLTEIYGEALARVLNMADPELASKLSDDELVGHLLVLHDVHPESVEERVERALDGVRPYIESHGGQVELAEIDAGVARVRLSGACKSCSSSADTLEQAVSESVLALAPELTSVEQAQEAGGDGGSTESLIPVDALLSRTTGTT